MLHVLNLYLFALFKKLLILIEEDGENMTRTPYELRV